MCGCKMPFSDTHLNILDLCRLCLGKENILIPVFDSSLLGQQLCDKISVCLAVEIKSEDEVSQKICNHCLTKVNLFYDFRNATLECQKVLQRWVSEANQNQLNFEIENAPLNNKDTNEPVKEESTNELNKNSETDESDIDYDSRSDSESCNSDRNEVDNVSKDLKSVDSSVHTSATHIVLPESEVPGPSGLQEENTESPVIELKARFRKHNFKDSKGETYSKKKSGTNISSTDQDTKQNQNHLKNLSPPIHLKTAKVTSRATNREEIRNKECNKKSLECNMCQFTAKYKSQLDIHIKRHKKDYKIFCDICHKGFFYQYEISMHKALHEETNRFQCNVCQKKFVYRHSLISHSRKHAEALKPLETFQCDKCDKKFSHRSYLKRHIDVHTGVNRVICEVCGQVLCSNVALRAHRLTHTGERPFSCAICGKSFTSKKYMMVHKRMHTGAKPFKCKVCEKSFSQQSTLIVHSRYHSGERPYQCQVCCKAFVTKTILKVHQKSHAT